MLAGAGPAEAASLLPVMRDDLRLVAGARDVGGWIVIDPLRHAYFKISQAIFEVLSVWSGGTAQHLQSAYLHRYGQPLSADKIAEVAQFLTVNELTLEPKEGGWRSYAGLAQSRQKSWLSKGFHSYLFFRVPLLRPQKFIDLAWPIVRPLFTRGFAVFWSITGLLALWLVSRQWDVFLTTFSSFLTWRGAATYGVMLAIVKIIHEFGHAFMARKFNVAVPTLGAAFIVLFPILYTDTTAAWQVSRRERLLIDAGGIFSELALAVLATLLWVFLPDGELRALAFVVATLSWVLSLAVNLNPLMRFDGYYLLSDGLGVENLQARGFALARWRMREFLFGLGEAPPENMSSTLRRGLIFHAYATWIYRFFLFLGIALVVYHMFFKLAGIALFCVEIAWFIALPIIKELKEWKMRMGKLRFNWPLVRTGLLGFGLVVLLAFPWQRSVSAPAVYSAGEVTQLFAKGAGKIADLHIVEGGAVKAGDILAVIKDVTLEARIARAKKEIALLKVRLARSSKDAQDRSFRAVLMSELESKEETLAAFEKRRNDMVLRAPADGVVSNVEPNLAQGRYVSATTRLGILTQNHGGEIKAFLSSEVSARIKQGAGATFIAEEPEMGAVHLSVVALAPPVASDPSMQLQFDVFGGDIETRPSSEGGSMVSRVPRYQVSFASAENLPAPRYEMRGTVHIDAQAESLGRRIARQVAGVLIRESGF